MGTCVFFIAFFKVFGCFRPFLNIREGKGAHVWSTQGGTFIKIRGALLPTSVASTFIKIRHNSVGSTPLKIRHDSGRVTAVSEQLSYGVMV